MDKTVQAEGTLKWGTKLEDKILCKPLVCLMKGGETEIKMCFKWEMMGQQIISLENINRFERYFLEDDFFSR